MPSAVRRPSQSRHTSHAVALMAHVLPVAGSISTPLPSGNCSNVTPSRRRGSDACSPGAGVAGLVGLVGLAARARLLPILTSIITNRASGKPAARLVASRAAGTRLSGDAALAELELC